MTVTSCVRADVLLARATLKHHVCTRFRAVTRPRSLRLRMQVWPRAADSGGSTQPPPPPKGKDGGDKPGGHSGGPYEGFIAFLFCVFMALFTPRATALESLPIDTDLRDSGALRIGGAREGVKDDLETIRRLLRDLFMEQLSLRKRQDALDQPSQQQHSLVDHTAASALRRRWKFMQRIHSDALVTISHHLELQGGCTSADREGENVLSSLHTGPRLHSLIDSQLDSDTCISVRTMSSTEGISLWQAQLKRVLWNRLTILMTPVGARFKDIAQSLHASKGELTRTCLCRK
jgi:hypothetical protein